jgi:hypothetical protein
VLATVFEEGLDGPDGPSAGVVSEPGLGLRFTVTRTAQ